MDTELGRNMILWTVRISVACYAVAVWRYVFHRPDDSRGIGAADKPYILAWAASWCFCVIHVICAYHFEHRWNQAAALQHTADMTYRVVGINWPGGLYVNYVFLIYWGYDVFCRANRGGRSSFAMHVIAAFMMINATVVFGPRWWFVPTVAFVFAMLVSVFRHRQNKATSTPVDTR